MKIKYLWLFFLLILLTSACSMQKKYPDLTYYKDGKFHNFTPAEKERGFLDVIKWKWSTDPTPWPENVELQISPQKPLPISEPPSITFINHSTFLIQVDGINILTDPIFSERTSPVQWAGPKRVIKPGIAKEDIPKIDIIIISHNHYDHLDFDSLTYFKKRDNAKIYAGLEVGRIDRDLEIIEMAWWQSIKTDAFELVFTPCQHFSGRSLWDRNETLWGGFYFKSKSLSFYHAGDTGYADHFKEIHKRFGPVDLAMIPIGAYEPRWFMKYVHLDPQDAVMAHQDLQPNLSLGMHWGTFQLTDEGRMQPVEELNQELAKKKITNFKVLDFGETILINHKENHAL